MKTRNIFLFAAAMVAASCVKETLPADNGQVAEPVLVPMEFTASVETKAGLLDDGKTVNWNDDDAICLFDNLGGDLKFTATTGGADAVFSGSVTEGATEYYALYPYRDGAIFDIETNKVSSELNPIQIAVTGSYATGDGGAVMVAKAEGNVLSFKNVTSHIRFTLADDMTDVKSITLMGNKSEVLCGTYSIDWNGGEPTVTVTSKETYVTLRNADGSALVPGDYFFTVLPVEFAEGFTVILSKTDGSQVAKKTTNSITSLNKRNQILPMKALASSDYSDHLNYFVKYNDGFDITIGGYTFNNSESSHPGGVLVNDTKGNTALNSDGLYFVESMTTSAKFTSVRKVSKYLVIGADAAVRTKFVAEKAIRPLTDGTILMFANLDYSPTATNYLVHHDENKFENFGAIVLSNCHFRNIKNTFMAFQLVNWSLDNLVVEDSEFAFNKAAAYLLNCGSYVCEIENMSVANNIFYSTEEVTMTDFKLINGTALKLTTLLVDANTFDSTIIGANMLNIGDASSINLTRNLYVNCSSATDVKLIKFNSENHLAENVKGIVKQNYAYTTGTGTLGNGIGNSGGYTGIEFITLRPLGNNPLSADWDPETDAFGAYSSEVPEGVGAQRVDMTAAPSDIAAANYVSVNLGTL